MKSKTCLCEGPADIFALLKREASSNWRPGAWSEFWVQGIDVKAKMHLAILPRNKKIQYQSPAMS